MADLHAVLADLRAEGDDLDALVSALPDSGWATPTPAEGWTVADQIGHLAWTDEIATQAIVDPAGFQHAVQEAFAAADDAVDRAARERGAGAPEALLDAWRSGRERLAAALRAVPDDARIAWFGPPMGATSMATARLMETWAHGQDVADALGVARLPTARLRHVAHLGVRTRAFAYLVNERVSPEAPVRVELSAPDGSIWTWHEDAEQSVTGPALDFCLLVTQRRHRDDLALVADGPDAEEWLSIAQAFAGPPGGGRAPAGPRPS